MKLHRVCRVGLWSPPPLTVFQELKMFLECVADLRRSLALRAPREEGLGAADRAPGCAIGGFYCADETNLSALALEWHFSKKPSATVG